MIEHARDGQMNAIGGRAVDEIEAVGGLSERERTIKGERIARTAAITLGRDHRDVAQVMQRVGQSCQAGREIAVVVAQKYAHWIGSRRDRGQRREGLLARRF